MSEEEPLDEMSEMIQAYKDQESNCERQRIYANLAWRTAELAKENNITLNYGEVVDVVNYFEYMHEKPNPYDDREANRFDRDKSFVLLAIKQRKAGSLPKQARQARQSRYIRNVNDDNFPGVGGILAPTPEAERALWQSWIKPKE